MKRKKKVENKSRKEIWHSVFAPQMEPVPTDNDIPVRVNTSSYLSTWYLCFLDCADQNSGPQAAYDARGLSEVSLYRSDYTKAVSNGRRLVDTVKDAIADGIHPKMISKGSSGSYFARARNDGKVQTVA